MAEVNLLISFQDEVSSLVYDLGTFYCRVGYSGEDTPKCVLQPYVGINKQGDQTSHFIAENNLRYFKENTKVHNVFSTNGLILKSVENFDLFEMLTDEIFEEHLRVESIEHPILFSEPSHHNKENRMKLVEMMFEKYSLPALFICKSAVLSAFSAGRSTCLVFDSGHNTTTAVPVHDGYALQKSMLKFEVAGNYMTKKLLDLTEKQKGIPIVPHYKFTKNKVEDNFVTEYIENVIADYSYENYWKSEIARDMKETCLAFNEEPLNLSAQTKDKVEFMPSNTQPIGYELPDGKYVELGEERVTIPERLFYPNKNFPGFNGYHQMIIDAINKGDIDIRKELFANILVCGGNTLFSGFPEHLQKQLYNSSSQALKIKVITHPSPTERKFSSYIGGSILSSLGTFHQIWMSKQEYEEHGAMIIERKCP